MSTPKFKTEHLAARRETIDVSTGGRVAVSAVKVAEDSPRWDIYVRGEFTTVPVPSKFPSVQASNVSYDRVEYAATVIAAGLDALGDLPGPKTHAVQLALEVVACDTCDEWFGLPLYFSGVSFHCPKGHPNVGRAFGAESAQ